jgi:hypothetical protein
VWLKNECQKDGVNKTLRRNSKGAILSKVIKTIVATNEKLDAAFFPLPSLATLLIFFFCLSYVFFVWLRNGNVSNLFGYHTFPYICVSFGEEG